MNAEHVATRTIPTFGELLGHLVELLRLNDQAVGGDASLGAQTCRLGV